MESDTAGSIRRRTGYICRSAVDVTQASVLTPLPGTKLFRKLEEEGRILCQRFPGDWQHFHFSDVVFRPAHMTAEELARETDRSYRRVTGMGYLCMRFVRTLWNTRSLRSAVWAWKTNLNYRKVAREKKPAWTY
jgi:hypothetical protein